MNDVEIPLGLFVALRPTISQAAWRSSANWPDVHGLSRPQREGATGLRKLSRGGVTSEQVSEASERARAAGHSPAGLA